MFSTLYEPIDRKKRRYNSAHLVKRSRTTGIALVATFEKRGRTAFSLFRSFLVPTFGTEGYKTRSLSTKDELSDNLDVLDPAALENQDLRISAGHQDPFDCVSRT